MKICNKCLKSLPDESFARRSNGKTYGRVCMECQDASAREFRRSSRTKQNAYWARFRRKHAKAVKAAQERVREEWREEYKKMRKAGRRISLTPGYVRGLLTNSKGLVAADIPMPMVELKTAELRLRRWLRDNE